MAIFFLPDPISMVIKGHDRIRIINGSKCFACPAHCLEMLVAGMAGVNTAPIPGPNEKCRLNGAQLVEEPLHYIF